MLSFVRNKNIAEKPHKIEDTINSIQQGDFALREKLILEYKPFILKCVSMYNHSLENDYSSDEFSIALIAFNEAINTYKIVKGMSFLNFSQIVIRNRLNDYARKKQKDKQVVSLESLRGDNEENHPYDVPTEDKSFLGLEVRDEINALIQELKQYQISLGDLIHRSPKQVDTRKRMIHLARLIHDNSPLLSKLKRTKGIPIKELMELSPVCRKTIEQNRKYIIALVVILDSKFETMKGYISNCGRSELNAN
ncbi:MAG: RNA polymerase sigma-I factor [Ruminiclostridium sp.]|nr:RNA polymerase sigma-I factor [Ruminiclostridium sp.]